MEVHDLLSILPGVLTRLNDGSQRHELRERACLSLLEIHKIISDSDIFVSADLADRVLHLADEFLLLNNAMMQLSLERNQLFYHHVFKTHLMWHICHMARFQNPKWTACFEVEDLMGCVKVCAQSAMAGSSLPLIGSKVIEHFCLALHLKLQASM